MHVACMMQYKFEAEEFVNGVVFVRGGVDFVGIFSGRGGLWLHVLTVRGGVN